MLEVQSPSKKGLNFEVIPWYKRELLKLSDFDEVLRSQWRHALSKGIFLHRVESEPNRVPGSHGYVAVLCRNRASQKRKSQPFVKLIQEQDPKSFNFTKVKSDEILMKIEMNSVSANSDLENGTDLEGSSQEVKSYCHVMINNSPYEFGHSLLVPEMEKLLIQSIDLNSIKFGIEILLRSSHPGFRVMYNSLCGGASVNHLHLHCYYTEYWLPSEVYRMFPLVESTTKNMSESCMNVLKDCFELDHRDTSVRGFGFIVTRDNYDITLPTVIHKLVNYFTERNIAHNMVIIRGAIPNAAFLPKTESLEFLKSQKNGTVENGNEKESDPEIPLIQNDTLPYGSVQKFDESELRSYPLVGRVYIYPRKPILGEKCHRKFHVNVTELFDHLYFGDVDVFNSMNEEDITKAKEEGSFSEIVFKEVRSDVIEILSKM